VADLIASQSDYVPLEPVRCEKCGSRDTLPLPVVTLRDRLRWAAFYAPFKCRYCHGKMYRRVKKKVFMD
jgi:hypothetical protein